MTRFLYKFNGKEQKPVYLGTEGALMRSSIVKLPGTLAIFLMTALLAVAFAGCQPAPPDSIDLDETPVLSGGLGWGVVSLSYVRLRKDASSSSEDSGAARRGDVGRIIARSRIFEGRDTGVWYRLEIESLTGWLHESAVIMYQSEAEARKASGLGS